jgi:hypothetical protein
MQTLRAIRLAGLLCLAPVFCYGPVRAADDDTRPRLLVMTDMGADPDDQQSLVRLLVYSNEFDIEGLLVTSAGTTGKAEQHVIRPELVHEILSAYGQARGNLARHASGYPAAESLAAVVKRGNPRRGRAAIGEGQDTEASQWLIAAGDRGAGDKTSSDRADARPLNTAIWGGQTDLAQALWRVKTERGAAGLAAFAAGLRVYDIADQDGLAAWIQEQCPELFYVQAGAPSGRDKREGVFRGMYLGGDESLVSREWMETNIRQNHGPLGALYPPRTWTAPNPHAAMKEGDTPSWFYFLPHGLNDPAHPEWGGWGGRFQNSDRRVYRDAIDRVGAQGDARSTVWRWRPAYQADFAARLDWCVADSFEKANHPPVAAVNGDTTRQVARLTARAGEKVELSAARSHDADGQPLSFHWFVYPEAGTFRGVIELSSTGRETATVIAPEVEASRTIHIIVEVRDNGQPPLTSLRRAVVSVLPR